MISHSVFYKTMVFQAMHSLETLHFLERFVCILCICECVCVCITCVKVPINLLKLVTGG